MIRVALLIASHLFVAAGVFRNRIWMGATMIRAVLKALSFTGVCVCVVLIATLRDNDLEHIAWLFAIGFVLGCALLLLEWTEPLTTREDRSRPAGKHRY